MQFQNKFWDDKDRILIANDKRGYYPHWKPLENNVLMVELTGSEAKRVEKLDEDTIKDEI